MRKLDRQNQIESRTGTFSTTSRIGSNWRLFLPLRALESTSKVRMPPRPSNSCPCQRCSHSLLVTQPRACALQGLKDTSSRAFRVGTLPMKVTYPSHHLSLSSTPSSRLTSAPYFSPLNSPRPPSLALFPSPPQPHPPPSSAPCSIPKTMCSVHSPTSSIQISTIGSAPLFSLTYHHTQHTTHQHHRSPLTPSLLPLFSNLLQVLHLCLAPYQQWQWTLFMDVRRNLLVDACTWHAGAAQTERNGAPLLQLLISLRFCRVLASCASCYCDPSLTFPFGWPRPMLLILFISM